VRRLLDLNRPHEPAADGIDLAAAIDAEMPTLDKLLRGHAVRFVPHPEPLPVSLRPDDIRELLTNLATNARDAMGEDGGTFTLRLHRQHRPDGADRVILTAEDNGAGFSAEAQEHLFEPFFSTKSPAEGSGLGLASIQFATQQAGGEVRVHSRPGRGSRIEIVLPLYAPKPS
jgi:signal transduction histidine kinase